MNVGGGTASLGAVSLTASPAAGTLNIYGNATVTVSNITSTGSGTSTLSLDNATLNVSLATPGNPVTAPVAAGTFSANDTVNLGVNGSSFTVGQFPLISYTGTIGGSGFSALNLASLPPGVSGYLSNNVANLSVDVVITNAPPVINTNPTNITFSVSGSTLSLSWPANQLGWRLETNGSDVANTNDWFTYPGSTNVTSINIQEDPSHTNVFFRLVYP